MYALLWSCQNCIATFATVEHLGDCLGALTGMQLAKFEVLLCSQAADGCCMQKMAVMS